MSTRALNFLQCNSETLHHVAWLQLKHLICFVKICCFLWWAVIVSSCILWYHHPGFILDLYPRSADPGEGVASAATSNMQYACGELGTGIQVQRVIHVSWLSDWIFWFQLNILGRLCWSTKAGFYSALQLFVWPCLSNPGYVYFDSIFGEKNLTSKSPWMQRTFIFETGRRETRFEQPNRRSRPGWQFVLQTENLWFVIFTCAFVISMSLKGFTTGILWNNHY